MNTWTTRLATSLAVLVAIPVSVEALIAYIKDEDYSWVRATVVLGCLLVVVVVLLILRQATRQLQLAVESAILALGFAVLCCGALIVGSAPDREMRYAGAVVVCLGLLVTALSAYLIYLARSGADLAFAVRRNVPGRTDRQVAASGHELLVRKFPVFEDNDEDVVNLCLSGANPADVHFLPTTSTDRAAFTSTCSATGASTDSSGAWTGSSAEQCTNVPAGSCGGSCPG